MTPMAEYVWALFAAHVGIVVNLVLLLFVDVESGDR